MPFLKQGQGSFSPHTVPRALGAAQQQISWRRLRCIRKWSKTLPIILVFLLSACGPSGVQQKKSPAAPSLAEARATIQALDTDGDGKIIFQGLVLDNDHGCEVDARCVLRISVDGSEFNTVYHYGEWPPCENVEASEQGFGMVAGDRVEIHAGITDDGGLSTCDEMEFYIRKIDAG